MPTPDNRIVSIDVEKKEQLGFNREHYGDPIRKWRIGQGLSQQQLAEKLGLTKNLIGHWETGRTRPTLNLIPDLCEIFHITIASFFGIAGEKSDLSFGEQKMIRYYRMLTPNSRTIIDRTIDTLLDLEDSTVRENCEKGMITLIRNDQQACAGLFNPLETNQTGELIYVHADELTRQADEIIVVSGDSMEPTFYNGDELIVKHTERLNYGDIGVFVINGEGFVKEYRGNGVYSHNSESYPFRKFVPGDEVRCVGKVLGKLRPEHYPTRQERMMLNELRLEKEGRR